MSSDDGCCSEKDAFDKCVQRENVSFDGIKFFVAGALCGASLTALVPKQLPLVQRQLPFLVLGIGGICMDSWHVNRKCEVESQRPAAAR